ncbi:hypothetical protein BT63DRAFT_475766 [Microthyrium microscopicum]|uniref:Uncharacterized protein n=1 Tax=Microthyrium microscopicum TaxID=703497 RepID=A0A6A6ULR0_9PEZI|nr:hypothetical protein BT63DRAFT_475766 [Microthyrium microscopicum]
MSEETRTLKSICQSLKRDLNHHDLSHLACDGVYRIYQSETLEVLDAVRLSNAQIKEYLDRLPFSQAKEDAFRGVDGRGVSDQDMFNPPDEFRFKPPSRQKIEEVKQAHEERKRNGFKKDPNAVCGLPKSNYNLDPI